MFAGYGIYYMVWIWYLLDMVFTTMVTNRHTRQLLRCNTSTVLRYSCSIFGDLCRICQQYHLSLQYLPWLHTGSQTVCNLDRHSAGRCDFLIGITAAWYPSAYSIHCFNCCYWRYSNPVCWVNTKMTGGEPPRGGTGKRCIHIDLLIIDAVGESSEALQIDKQQPGTRLSKPSTK